MIQGVERKKIEKLPEAAFREAIANALIHRVWDVESQIRVSMFDDRIEIVSPGGLPSGITETEYLSDDEREIYKLLSKAVMKPISEIVPYVSLSKSKTTQLLKDMEKKGVIIIAGKGRGTKYIIK